VNAYEMMGNGNLTDLALKRPRTAHKHTKRKRNVEELTLWACSGR